MVIEKSHGLCLRPLKRNDLRFVHELNNDTKIMHYWFKEPYEASTELSRLYDHHMYDQRERRFIYENDTGEAVGLAGLMELNYIHRRDEFQIIIAPGWQDHDYASTATRLAIDYVFMVLNLYKLYLVIDVVNERAIHVHEKCGSQREGELIEELFSNDAYHNVLRMYVFQRDYVKSIRETN